VDRGQLIDETWQAVSAGDLGALEVVLADDAKWRAVQDGPWNCDGRAMILEVMASNVANGLSGEVEEVLDVGDRAIVAFRPRDHAPGAWPLDDGIRYVVLSFRDEKVVEMKGCPDRATALAYAAAP
jgi:ketosteroid isomerase-like protein